MNDPLATAAPFAVRRLRDGDDALFAAMLDLFARVFEEPETYAGRRSAAG